MNLVNKFRSFTTFRRFPIISYYSTKKNNNNNNNNNNNDTKLKNNNDKFSKPYDKTDKTEQTCSGTTNQIAHTKTAFDKNNIKPENEIEEMKKIDKQDSLEWSSANKQISDHTNSKPS
ncbi:hypothetical protein Glove_330g63 [Diversispora epigaea]|uniref:Uncharacterized protein n=1 Tax=Diversispora epigaea TaxID=1348612 RepID=A0A397HNV1_9GLOM|nr:hypothetical protein Glove_330g63 [Diversispora epigaea]